MRGGGGEGDEGREGGRGEIIREGGEREGEGRRRGGE